jgi:hypothetical protein
MALDDCGTTSFRTGFAFGSAASAFAAAARSTVTTLPRGASLSVDT